MHDNLRNLGLDVLDVVNLRIMFDVHGPAEGSIEAPLTVLAELQRQGLVRHIGLSNVTPTQIAEGRRICEIVCVQNQYNLAHRDDDALIDDLARDGIAYVPFFPLGGFNPLQSSTLSDVAARLGATPMQVALAWLLRRAPNILLIPGTSSVAHLRENLAAAELDLPNEALIALDGIAERRFRLGWRSGRSAIGWKADSRCCLALSAFTLPCHCGRRKIDSVADFRAQGRAACRDLGGLLQRCFGVPLDPLHHRAQSIGALRRQMLVETEIPEHGFRIRADDLAGMLAGKQGQHDGDEAANDMRVGIALKLDDRVRTLADIGGEPDLADAAADLVPVDARLVRKRRQRLSQIDDIAITVLPLVEEGKIVAYRLDRLRHQAGYSYRAGLSHEKSAKSVGCGDAAGRFDVGGTRVADRNHLADRVGLFSSSIS